jgi:hypothetical protein
MGLALPLVIVFGFVFVIIYSYMLVSCYVRNKFTDPNSWILRFFTKVLMMCESCRDACNDHKKMLIRSLALSAFIAVVVVLTIWLTR